MAILNILTAPDPKLRLKAERVEDIAAVQGLIDDMLETLYATENGIGLARDPKSGVKRPSLLSTCPRAGISRWF